MVESAEALQVAVVEGTPHIEIRAHLDLTTLELANQDAILGPVPSTVESIRVRCCYSQHSGFHHSVPVKVPKLFSIIASTAYISASWDAPIRLNTLMTWGLWTVVA